MCYFVIILCVVFGVMVVLWCCTEFGVLCQFKLLFRSSIESDSSVRSITDMRLGGASAALR